MEGFLSRGSEISNRQVALMSHFTRKPYEARGWSVPEGGGRMQPPQQEVTAVSSSTEDDAAAKSPPSFWGERTELYCHRDKCMADDCCVEVTWAQILKKTKGFFSPRSFTRLKGETVAKRVR